MLHTLSVIGWMALQPSSLLAGLGLLGIVLVSRRRVGAGLACLWTASLTVALITFVPVSDWLFQKLEDRFQRPTLAAAPTGIIILGGAEDARVALARGVTSLNEAGERIVEAAALARRYPEAKIIISGGSASLVRALPPEAETAAKILEDIGVARGRMILEARSRNTGENAVFTRQLGVVKTGERWLLVTSAWHMPRSMAAFRAAGLDVVPYPVDYRSEPGALAFGMVRSVPEALRRLDTVVREWVGLVGYRITGRSKAILPDA
jgi:uncharacterized SAM-binding protein YcdF (DUF218 family)